MQQNNVMNETEGNNIVMDDTEGRPIIQRKGDEFGDIMGNLDNLSKMALEEDGLANADMFIYNKCEGRTRPRCCAELIVRKHRAPYGIGPIGPASQFLSWEQQKMYARCHANQVYDTFYNAYNKPWRATGQRE